MTDNQCALISWPRKMANQILVEKFLEEINETKNLFWMDGQKRTMELTCSIKNCGIKTECILDALKHHEETHLLIATKTSNFFIDQEKSQKKLYYIETPEMDCIIKEIAWIKNPFDTDQKFINFLRAHFIKSNFWMLKFYRK